MNKKEDISGPDAGKGHPATTEGEDASVKLRRETVKIEGDRNLYNYTFELAPTTAKPARNQA
jgi:hypothetical protein